jgi:hypothetical protein
MLFLYVEGIRIRWAGISYGLSLYFFMIFDVLKLIKTIEQCDSKFELRT